MKLATASIVLLFVSGCQAASTETVSEAKSKLVELHTTRESNKTENASKAKRRIEKFPSYGVCAGSFISPAGDILTAQHCVEGATSLEVQYGDKVYRATVTAVSRTQDLALVSIDAYDTPYFQVARSLAQGQVIHVLGSPLGLTGTYSTGTVARLGGDVDYLDCGVLPGNSGGPVFNDDGKLVGVAIAGFIVMAGTTHLNIIQGHDSISSFLWRRY